MEEKKLTNAALIVLWHLWILQLNITSSGVITLWAGGDVPISVHEGGHPESQEWCGLLGMRPEVTGLMFGW